MTALHDPDDSWVVRLRDSRTQSEALSDLRSILMRGLWRAFDGKGGGESFCEDVAQETLLRVLEKLDQFCGRSHFTTWAMAIGVRIGTSHLRRASTRQLSLSSLGADANLTIEFADESAVTPETHQFRLTLVAMLNELIATSLTDRQRQATEAILHGIPIEEIALRTDSTRNAVYKLIHDARMKLKAGLESAGYCADDIVGAFA